MKQLFTYTAISALALGLDTGILFGLVHYAQVFQGLGVLLESAAALLTGWLPLTVTLEGIAAALGNTAGLVLHFTLSMIFIFHTGPGLSYWDYASYFAAFTLTALVGTVLTMYIVSYGSLLEMHLLLSKAIAVAVAFISVFLIRKYVVFRKQMNPTHGKPNREIFP